MKDKPMFTIALNDLRPHTASVRECAWKALLRNPAMISQMEEEMEGVMTAADSPCSVMLTPQPDAGTIQVAYQWLGDVDGSRSEFLRLALIDCLLEGADVAA